MFLFLKFVRDGVVIKVCSFFVYRERSAEEWKRAGGFTSTVKMYIMYTQQLVVFH